MSKDKYSVSLVYVKQDCMKMNYALRVLITDASNENEALGDAINHFSEELKGWLLQLKTVIKIEK